MTWRIHRDESNLSDVEVIAWAYVLPFKYLPILDEEKEEVKKFSAFLEEHFSLRMLRTTAKKIK